MDIKTKTINAINNNKLINLLEGAGSYRAELHQWVGANVPTDVGSILSKGIYEIYTRNHEYGYQSDKKFPLGNNIRITDYLINTLLAA